MSVAILGRIFFPGGWSACLVKCIVADSTCADPLWTGHPSHSAGANPLTLTWLTAGEPEEAHVGSKGSPGALRLLPPAQASPRPAVLGGLALSCSSFSGISLHTIFRVTWPVKLAMNVPLCHLGRPVIVPLG